MAALARCLLPGNHARIFQLAQSPCEQCARHQRYAAMNLVEMLGARKQLAQAHWRPALGKDFTSHGDWAELSESRPHAASLAPGGNPCKFTF